MLNTNLLLSVIAFAIAFTLLFARRIGLKQRNIPLPPGPRGLPIIGNLHDVQPSGHPGDYRWKRFLQWSREYNSPDAVSVQVFGERMIILNSRKAVVELLEKRSANYSDRPQLIMTDELSGWKWDLAHMRYSDRWRLHRKTFHQRFQPRVMPEYYDIQKAATEEFMQNLAASPENFVAHVRQQAGSIALKIAYGYELQGENDPYIQLAKNAAGGIIETLVPGSFLVDYLPILKYMPGWLPGAGFKKKAQIWKKYSEQVRDLPWEWHMKSISQGAAESSFVTWHLEKLSSSMEDDERQAMEEVIRNCAGMSFIAGADTTVSAILSFILNMARHPEIQSRAQAEVNTFGRLPDFSDMENLPYVEAVIAETLRLNPVTPLGVAHAALKDDVYEGMWIPKGSTVVGNAWAILHDEEIYGPDTMIFNPDRFMKKVGNEEFPLHPKNFAFGFGRRICPGRYLALNSIWIAIVHLLATFNITRDGEDIEVLYHDGHISHPYPFRCKFVPRSKLRRN